MADKTTIARPYARAAFEEARGQNRLGPWSAAVHAAAAVVTDPRVETLLGNPRVTSSELAELVIDIAGPQLGTRAATSSGRSPKTGVSPTSPRSRLCSTG